MSEGGGEGRLPLPAASVLIPAPEPQADATAEIGELKTAMAAVRDELTAIRELLDSRASAGGSDARE